MTCLRILYVGPELRYINPTGQLFIEMLSEAGQTVCFGPGFVSTHVLALGLQNFVEKHGPFDVAVTTELMGLSAPLATDLSQWTQRFKRLYTFDFPLDDLKYVKEIAKSFRKLSIPRVLSLLQDDLYGWTNQHVDLADSGADFFLGNGVENVLRITDMQFRDQEPWSLKASDVFIDFMQGNAHRFASFPLFVSSTEIFRSAHANRPNAWAVPGVQYRARRIAAMQLRSAGYQFRKISPSRWIHRISEVVGHMPSLGIVLGNYLFRRELERSKAVYTCGSVLQQPIRKFFEIPASGALLVSAPCRGLFDYGFVDGVSCRICLPENVLDVDREIRSSPDAVEKIAHQGQEVVLRSHTLSARAAQFLEVVESIKKGQFSGARWSFGKYILAASSL